MSKNIIEKFVSSSSTARNSGFVAAPYDNTPLSILSDKGIPSGDWEFRIQIYPSKNNLKKAITALEPILTNSGLSYKMLAPGKDANEFLGNEWYGEYTGAPFDQAGKEICVYVRALKNHAGKDNDIKYQATPKEIKQLMIKCWKALIDAEVEHGQSIAQGDREIVIPFGDQYLPTPFSYTGPRPLGEMTNPIAYGRGIIECEINQQTQKPYFNPCDYPDPLQDNILDFNDVKKAGITSGDIAAMAAYRKAHLEDRLQVREQEINEDDAQKITINNKEIEVNYDDTNIMDEIGKAVLGAQAIKQECASMTGNYNEEDLKQASKLVSDHENLTNTAVFTAYRKQKHIDALKKEQLAKFDTDKILKLLIAINALSNDDESKINDLFKNKRETIILVKVVQSKIYPLFDKLKNSEEIELLVKIVTTTKDVLENPTTQNCQKLRKLANQAQGRPSPLWKSVGGALLSLAASAALIIGGFVLTGATFGALSPVGIGMVAAGAIIGVTGVSATLFSRKRTGLSKAMVELADNSPTLLYSRILAKRPMVKINGKVYYLSSGTSMKEHGGEVVGLFKNTWMGVAGVACLEDDGSRKLNKRGHEKLTWFCLEEERELFDAYVIKTIQTALPRFTKKDLQILYQELMNITEENEIMVRGGLAASLGKIAFEDLLLSGALSQDSHFFTKTTAGKQIRQKGIETYGTILVNPELDVEFNRPVIVNYPPDSDPVFKNLTDTHLPNNDLRVLDHSFDPSGMSVLNC